MMQSSKMFDLNIRFVILESQFLLRIVLRPNWSPISYYGIGSFLLALCSSPPVEPSPRVNPRKGPSGP